ncbi:MAG: ferritin-like domain-containing protein [Gemmatimonadaceae bacterium]
MEKDIIYDALENPSVLDRAVSRRGALRDTGMLGAGLALASMPVLMAAVTRRAFGQGSLPIAIQNVLNFALTLEFLEAEFYNLGLAASGLIPASDRAIFQQVAKHENAHVAFLQTVLGSRAVKKPNFDFTAGGQFDTFTNYQTFALLAQGFEDTGVRAYKGGLPVLQANDDILTAGARIHSVEARHASEIRRLRGLKGWIPFDGNDTPAVLAAVYAGEGNLIQLGVNVGKFEGDLAGTEAFDEPLGVREVLTIASLFIARPT